MKKFLATILGGSLMAFSVVGCAPQGATVVSSEDAQYVQQYETGVILSVKPVVVKDNGTGLFVGALTGAVLGSLVGEGKGNTLATLAGGLAGAYAGSQAGAANAQELFIRLDDGRKVAVIAKGTRFHVGERVRVVTYGSRLTNVEPL